MRNTCLTMGLLCLLIFIIYNSCQIQSYKSQIKNAETYLNEADEPYMVFKGKSNVEMVRKRLRNNILSRIMGIGGTGTAIDMPTLHHDAEDSDIDFSD